MKKLIIFCLFCISQSHAQTASDNYIIPITIPEGVKTKPIEITQFVYDIISSTNIGKLSSGRYCGYVRDNLYFTDDESLKSADLTKLFNEVLHAANYNVPDASGLLFNDINKEEPVYYIAARIIKINANECVRLKTILFHKNKRPLFKSEYTYTLEWQLYDPLTKKIVYKKTFDGSSYDQKFNELIDAASPKRAIENSMKSLLADQEFYSLLTKEPKVYETNFDNLIVNYQPVSTDTDAISLAKAINSVVTIKTNSGHGSGFIISTDGYILTNQHVVGSNDTVIVAFDNGMEIEGNVIRREQQRDVALVKIPLSKLKPLALKLKYSEIGSKVYAIGAPNSLELQGSVSSGIVSTYRQYEKTELTILQSDTIVNGGNSGGPLVNEFGEVVAITVSKLNGIEGISFFIPIDSALDKLGIGYAGN